MNSHSDMVSPILADNCHLGFIDHLVIHFRGGGGWEYFLLLLDATLYPRGSSEATTNKNEAQQVYNFSRMRCVNEFRE